MSRFLEGLPFMDVVIFGNQIWQWLLALLLAVVLYSALRLALSQVGSRLARLTARTRSPVDDLLVAVLRSTRKTFVAVLAVALASLVLEVGGIAADVRRWLLVIALTVQVGLWGQRAIILWLELQRERLLEDDPGAVTTLQGLSYVARVALWGAVIVLMLDNLGYDVTALVAGLGIGGVAVALALQSVLGDLFASLSIALDKPFVTGDFIIVDDKLGTVSNIGLKTTRLASLSGEQLVFSNSDLLSSRIQNYKRMEERRVPFTVGVLYQTPVERLEEIPGLARSIIEATEHTRIDRAHFKGFGDSAYIFEFVYYVLAPDYNLFMDCQQQINLGLCRAFEERGIEFAYPTRTL
ncbi:MAG TPA: mechanosensitive ion channel family protein, partial [Methylomirabilota bacterium]|nr:mechanosensitive ion channel family protein [Methylomirabilota bacterium]